METQHHHQSPSSSSLLSPSPHLTSSQKLADIAARVVSELNLNGDDPFDYDHDFFSSLHNHPNDTVLSPDHNQNHSFNDDHNDNDNDDGNDDDDDDDSDSEFEFAILCGDDNSSPISADDIFSNGQIKPMYPLFDTSLLHQNDIVSSNQSQPSIRLPLRKLMTEDRECVTNSCSSSEADDLDGVPQDTYCVWVPKEKNKKKSQNDDVLMRKKSKSTGSNSKRWRIRDLVHRSNSDGKDTFVFLTPNHHHQHRHGNHHQHGGDPKKRSQQVPVTKNKTYLPYRQDLVGFFSGTKRG